MAESVITLGIGSDPGSVEPFILVGLHAAPFAPMTPTPISGEGSFATIAGSGSNATLAGQGSNATLSGDGGV